MKKQFLLGLLMASATAVFAQPTLTKATNNPVAGDKFYGYICDTAHVSKGSSGASVTWDMSALVKSDSDTTSFFTCAATPYCDSFSGTDIVMLHDGDYAYGVTGANGIEFTGIYSGGNYIHLTNSNTYTRFPLSYSTVVKDTFSSKMSVMGTAMYFTMYSSNVCDGWGKLVLPNGTFNNVLRVHGTLITKDSFNIMGMPQVSVSQTETYNWYMSGFHSPLLTIDYDTSGSAVPYVTDVKYYKATPPSTGIADARVAATMSSIYPNPASDQLHVAVNMPGATNATIAILNMTGQVVYSVNDTRMNAGMNEVQLPVGMLPNGLYMVRLQSNDAQLTGRFTVAR